MRPESLIFAILHLTDAISNNNSLHSRIREILRGPPQRGPVPPVKAAFLLCNRPGSENVNRELARAAGEPSALFVLANPDPKAWSAVLNNFLTSYDDHLVSFVLDMGCAGATDLLQRANDTKMFRLPYRWLLIYPSFNVTSMSLEICGNQAEAVLGKFEIFLDSEVVSMCRFGDKGQSGVIIEWYRYRLLERPFMGELGSWQGDSEYSRIKWTERSFKSLAVRRANLMGLTVNCGFVLRYNDTLLHLMDGVDTRKDVTTKFFYPILANSVEMVNGTMRFDTLHQQTLILVKVIQNRLSRIEIHKRFIAKWTDTWGFPVNGTWNGMVGMQLRGEVDLSGIPALMEHVRNSVLSYVAFRAASSGTFLFRATPMSYEANLFALPFPESLWAAVGGLISLCFLLLYLVLSAEDMMDRYRPRTAPTHLQIQPLERGKTPKPKPFLSQEQTEEETKDNMEVVDWSQKAATGIQAKARLQGSWSDVMLLVFGAICQQGSPVEARSIPGRIVSLCLLLAIIFLFTSYSASIVVLLQSTSHSIQTLADLRDSRMPCGAEDLPYTKYFFAQVQGDVRKGIVKKIQMKNKNTKSGNNYMPLEAGMHRLRTEYFAFHALSTSMFPIISDTWREHEKCALREMPNFVYPQNPYVSTSKFHPIVEMFRITLRKMQERGIRDREIGRIVPPKPKCTDRGSNFNSVSISDCYFAVVILSAGLLVSLLVLGLEHLVAYGFRKIKTNVSKTQ